MGFGGCAVVVLVFGVVVATVVVWRRERYGGFGFWGFIYLFIYFLLLGLGIGFCLGSKKEMLFNFFGEDICKYILIAFIQGL